MMLVSPARLAEVFVEVADTLVDEFDMIEFMQGLSARATEVIGARASGLLLADERGDLQLMAASDERAEMLELFQVQALEGPCLDCYRGGVAVVNADLAGAVDRWPRFAPRAVGLGYRSVHAFPLRLRGRVLGALNLFGDVTGRLDAEDMRVVQALADVATIGLLQEQAIRRGEWLAEQLQTALNSRVVIEQAKGMLAQIRGSSPEAAFEAIRDYSRARNLKVSAVARAFVTDPTSLPELTS